MTTETTTTEKISAVYGDQTRTIVPPDWRGLLGAMLAVLCNEDAPIESRNHVRAELFRMATAADNWNKHCNESNE